MYRTGLFLHVFKISLTQPLGVNKSLPSDWKQTQVAWIFSLAIVMLGLSAAVFGRWSEKAGPRKAMFAAAVCFALGFYVSYLGVATHRLWLIYLGYGVIGGTGLGLGYTSPVSTLIKWFPDRPGLATGMAIMGFGGGAMIGSPLGIQIDGSFPVDTRHGRWKDVPGHGHAIFSTHDVWRIYDTSTRDGWKLEHWTPSVRPQAL
jgi:MFS family permease